MIKTYLKKQSHVCKRAMPCLLLALFFAASTGPSPVIAATGKNVSFQWQSNPTSENVVGYKLYYGKNSRFYVSGNQKPSFKYEYCVDFTERTRCSGANYSNCEDLGPAKLYCENLYTQTPKCTLKNIYGNNYFALTAYNNNMESGFTHELKMINAVSLSAVYEILLD